MFYSHEILTSQQYGVATVWLVSTIGLRSTNRKISRKAIQDVNVRKACETILQPGAPIALRLQGSLLYGVSRVYSQQCSYVLTDAEKIQTHMRAFYSVLGGSENAIDPRAGKANRNQLILLDDPEFDLNIDLPALHFDDEGNLTDAQGIKASQKTSSQFSPLERNSLSSIGADSGSFLAGFDLPHSSPGGRDSQVKSPFKPPFTIDDMVYLNAEDKAMPTREEEEPVQVFDDWGIEIDADGNLIGLAEEPELPTLPHQITEQVTGVTQTSDPFVPFSDAQGDVVMNLGETPLPEAEAFAPLQEEQQLEQVLSSDKAIMPTRRRRRQAQLAPDEMTYVSREVIRGWETNYLANAEQARRIRRGVTVTTAKKNAYHFVFGRGIANTGFPTGIPVFPDYPLAKYFSGDGLQARLFGMDIDDDEEEEQAPRGHRRTRLESLELEEDDEARRRVRRRLSGEDEQQSGQGVTQQQQSQTPSRLLAEEETEIGREAGPALSDLPSDVPWNRGSSQVLGSSIKGSATGRGQSRQVSASPLQGRGNRLPSDNIELFSDQPVFGSDGDFPMYSAANIFSSDPIEVGDGSQQNATAADTSQVMREALDREGRNFLGYVETIAKEKGLRDQHEDQQQGQERYWVNFEDLFDKPDKNRTVVVQAFSHVLALATKDAIKAHQECENMTPFGPIRVGVVLSTNAMDIEEGQGKI
ncbi:Rec8 like protein-domain-containing protein [Apodospora peruviana]|uniref:Rec8 like protein-domain-containing protein n=1 Tax=Apodospora peruviana TaxID=516989 RepID=A0AAE0MGX3_9PEZI|nr:Rec8 like protein-domain-containing protein [Apodospora peruviana]